jgi:murein DD-endopeptidase MepM/ murein hydrolase activator NlpD
MGSYTPSGAGVASHETTGSVQAPVQRPAPSGQWSWDGGTAVTVKPGESVSQIARRHGVPVSAVEQANNLGPNGAIYPGQRLVIPQYKQASAPAAVAPKPVAAHRPIQPAVGALSGVRGPGGSGVHVVAQGDTLSRLSRRYGKSVSEIARANHIEPTATLKIGDRLTIPGVRISKAAHKEPTKVAHQDKPLGAPPAAPAVKPPQPHKQAAAPAAPTESASVVTPSAETPAPTTGAVKAADGGPPSFRWPAKGRVIAGYGPKTNGQQNDGINLAVPEGTPVKAAEDGVVAYAGNELKGYGNLVLVRHSNGYVTAYAHAKELLVKRGDHIKRGQVIAKSGQTGNVDGPQLHFEIRHGRAPLDPLPLLRGG